MSGTVWNDTRSPQQVQSSQAMRCHST
jgi:hypothetical protein